MKLVVIREDGTPQILELHDGAWSITSGISLDLLRCDDIEYFFTKEGFYDGWGTGDANAILRGLSDAKAGRVVRLKDIDEALRGKQG